MTRLSKAFSLRKLASRASGQWLFPEESAAHLPGIGWEQRRGCQGRIARLGLVAALSVAAALPALAAATAPSLGTETTLSTEINDQGGRTRAKVTVTVAGQDGLPAAGAVVIADEGKPLAGVALNAEGRAISTIALPPGEHNLTATYSGDATHRTSASQPAAVRAQSTATPGFSIAVAPAALTAAQGQSKSSTVSITPVNAASLTAPMFVTLSCSGLPDQASCTFTPENLEILPNATAAVTSSMVVATVAGSTARVAPLKTSNGRPVAWAVLVPGALGLMGLAFGARRRAWLSRLCLLAVLGLISTVGMTACAPRYNYYNHGPTENRPTPTGTYTLLVTAQTSNGITATAESTTLVLTVN